MLRVFIDPTFRNQVKWTLNLIAKDQSFSYVLVDSTDADLRISLAPESDVQISEDLFNGIKQKKFDANLYFSNELIIRNKQGNEDYLSTIFYLVNAFQEYQLEDHKKDHYGRFPFKQSVQYRFDIVEKNYVGELIARFMQSHPSLKKLVPKELSKSQIFLSHDIDSLYGSLYFDGKWALKHLNVGKMATIIWETVLRKPAWFNIDKIMNMHSLYDMKSTFFWILQQGKDQHGIKNGDYNIKSPKIINQINKIKDKGFQLGMHKSTMNTSFQQEKDNLPIPLKSNRYHFLKFNLPDAWEALETSKLKLDASLGFAECMGFRNSYGKPFQPYNLETNAAYSFLELPLHVMDGSFVYYQGIRDASVLNSIIQFIEKNKYNNVLSILWHNNELSEYFYKDMFENYKKLLAYLYEEKFETVQEDQLIKEYLYV